jgi:3'-phosphoadenosine 5'-phosphosulfate sulfotransferase (PAPS reductase)/FAD synthetase
VIGLTRRPRQDDLTRRAHERRSARGAPVELTARSTVSRCCARRPAARLSTIEGDAATGRIKINPVAPWSSEDIREYQRRHDLPPHPLVPRGYRSIGCVPCTRPVGPDEKPRAGRWPGLDKSECGIHLRA